MARSTRTDREVARWLDDEFPRLLRSAYRCQAHVVLLDASAFPLTPAPHQPPRGRPLPDGPEGGAKIAALGGLTVSPVRGRLGLCFQLLPDNAGVQAEDVVAFLERLRERFPRLTLVGDRSHTHSQARVLRAWLLDKPGVVVADLPGSVPGLNPAEGVWRWTRSRLAHRPVEDADGLRGLLWEELVSLSEQPDLLASLFRAAGLPGLLRSPPGANGGRPARAFIRP